MFRTSHIRTKLTAALAVPLAALVVVAGFEVVVATGDVGDTRSQSELATSSIGPGSLVTSLQDERNRAAIDLIGLGDSAGLPVADNAEARALVDAAAGALSAELEGAGSEVVAAFAPAWEAFADLEELRADIDAYSGPMDLSNDELADEVFTRYTEIVESFFDATATVARSVDDEALRNGVAIVDAAARQGEMRARIVRSIVLAIVTGAADAPAAGQHVAALRDRGRAFDDAIRVHAVGPYAGVADATFEEPGVQSFNRQVDAFLAGQPVSIDDLLGAVKSEPDIGYLGLRTRAATILSSEASRIEDAAVARQRLFGGLAVVVLLLALAVTWLASRSITRPLAALRGQAEDMANVTLPAAVREILDTPSGEDVVIPQLQPIEVTSRDEVAEVAAALNAVQTSALDLAVEQAVLRRNITDSYINLGRRNQNLLSRQLDFITELERNESDPDTLEGLFRLDHLATRMRRNAESLLVLAGIDPPRQWAAPVKVSDVVRAALSEVEDYQRAVVRHLEPAAITGAVAADVAHVLAELLENALSFSPPDQSVEIKGRLTTGGYTIAVSDNGLGMTRAELDRANRRLAGHESFTVAPSRYLGHYVAGHLASRLGVVVELQDSPAGGVTARVDIPMGLLANEETDPRLQGLAPATPAEPKPVEPAPVVSPAEPTPVAPAAAAPDAAPAPPVGRPELEIQPDEPAPSAPSFTLSGLPRRGSAPGPTSETAPTSETTALEPVVDEPRPEPEPEVDLAPATLADLAAVEPPETATAGFGGLAIARPQGPSLFSVVAQNARNSKAAAAEHEDDAPATLGGLTRRVPGAQRPDVPVGGSAGSEPAAAAPPRSTPEDVYSFLSSFQSGVSRGLAAAHPEHGDDAAEQREGDR